MLLTICKRFGIRIYILKITITVKIGCAPVAALPDLHGNQFFRNGESFLAAQFFMRNETLRISFYRFFCGKNVFAKE